MTHDLRLKKDPTSKALVARGSLINDDKEDALYNKQPFIHEIELNIPVIKLDERMDVNLPEEIEGLFQNLKDIKLQHYLMELSLIDFIKPIDKTSSFRNILYYYIQSDMISALSYNTKIDEEDVFSLDTNGLLILNLTKDTYTKLGLMGKQVEIRRRKVDRYIVQIDLKSEQMNSDSKLFQRVHWCFSNTFIKKIKFLISFVDPDNLEEINIEKLLKEINSETYQKIEMPSILEQIWDVIIPSEDEDKNIDEQCYNNIQEWMEWSGMISIQGIQPQNIEKYSNIESYSKGDIFKLKWKGFLSPYLFDKINSIFCEINTLLYHNKNKLVPFTSLIIHGFEDTSISWYSKNNSNFHSYFVSGENINVYYVFPSQPNIRFIEAKIASPNDPILG